MAYIVPVRRKKEMAKKYEAIGKDGKVHKRTTKNRTYAFAVIMYWGGYSYTNVNDGKLIEVPAGSSASWSSRYDLAVKEANKYKVGTVRDYLGSEIVEAKEIVK
jgi:hypothetical protein